MNKEAQKLGKIKSKRKAKTSAENGRKLNEIRARLTIYGHEDMSDKEFKFFKKWITIVVPETAKQKRGDLSKVFRQTLFKQDLSKPINK
jgi:hypothetical protein